MPIRLIKLARQANVAHCCIVTSKGTDRAYSSWFLLLRTKKAMENSVRDLKFNHTSIFRPGVLERGEATRIHENIMNKLLIFTVVRCIYITCSGTSLKRSI